MGLPVVTHRHANRLRSIRAAGWESCRDGRSAMFAFEASHTHTTPGTESPAAEARVLCRRPIGNDAPRRGQACRDTSLA